MAGACFPAPGRLVDGAVVTDEPRCDVYSLDTESEAEAVPPPSEPFLWRPKALFLLLEPKLSEPGL